VKRTLLAEVNVDMRARVLLDAMGEPAAKAKVRPAQGIVAPRGPYPPKFSVN
jgi:hypothetical protein